MIKNNEQLFLDGDIDELYRSNMNFIHYTANKFNNLNFEYEELISCGNLAFAKAIKSFNPSKCRWITYFGRIMSNEILLMNRKKKNDTDISIDEPFYIDESITIGDSIQSNEDTASLAINTIILKKILNNINTSDDINSIVFKLYLLGLRQEDISVKVNLTQSYISRIIKSMSIKFRNEYNEVVC